jgi:hypothetical protein
MGRLKDLTGSYSPALYALAALAIAVVFVLLLVIPNRDESGRSSLALGLPYGS